MSESGPEGATRRPARGTRHGRPAALVTGSAKGIGKAIALALAADGYDVMIHYRRSRAEADGVVEAATALGAHAVAAQADVTDESEARGLVDAAHSLFGRLDALVNNVGNYHHGPLADLSGEVWREMFASNLDATFYTCQRAVPYLRLAPNGGRIVNLGYAGAELIKARPSIVAYGIAKTGVILYSKALALAEAKNGITVNVVSPGVIENSVTKPLHELPMDRVGRLDEVVGAVRYFLSPAADYVTGTTLEVAGAWNV